MSQQNKTGNTKRYHNSQFVPPRTNRDTTYATQHNVGGSSSSSNIPDRIIPGPAAIREGGPEYALVPTQEYVRKVNEDVTEDEHFTSGPWLSAIHKLLNDKGVIVTGCLGDIKNNCVKGKLELVVAVIKSCMPNVLGKLTVTLKDPTGTISGTIHHKVLTEEAGYKNSIKVGAVLVLRSTNINMSIKSNKNEYLNAGSLIACRHGY
ncbi:hypothetical protein CTI12_AA249600 [Artemisia annua]|uniref:Homologous recombination OB-fold protein OB-fold domain-containing protein n=1 Tax=Artemisia annua TaxID=35608 RepID=A0A2U1NMF3_ARTAN|nr:hypothetical protein CTI12_AA249600 [Artemisia annua]